MAFSRLEGASPTHAAQVEEHHRPDGQDHGAHEEDARVGAQPHTVSRAEPSRYRPPLTPAALPPPPPLPLPPYSSLCFQFLLPVIQISLICLCVGGDPMGVQVAVVNNESSPSAFSRSLLSFLDESSIQQVHVLPRSEEPGCFSGSSSGLFPLVLTAEAAVSDHILMKEFRNSLRFNRAKRTLSC